ncbi:hypothetical protein QFC19_008082 [Naganishia cerealis]|uniref:Uncharacterized protein n=1 Tax=Naganishia cerealis TaxID=610337 RepID=A0ACC2V4W2_9TREE|nr:hypothetical protein QFC19_008082 [Naganishia cerealis]
MFSCINNTHFHGTPEGVPMMCAPGTHCSWVPGQGSSPCTGDESMEAVVGQHTLDISVTPSATPSSKVTSTILEEPADKSPATPPVVPVSPGDEESEDDAQELQEATSRPADDVLPAVADQTKFTQDSPIVNSSDEDTTGTNSTASAKAPGPTATPVGTTDNLSTDVEDLEEGEGEEEESSTVTEANPSSTKDVPDATVDPSSAITPAPSLMNALVDKAVMQSVTPAVSTLPATPSADAMAGTASNTTMHEQGEASINPQQPGDLTACGTKFSETANSEPYYVAIEEKYFKGPGYPNPVCGKEILLTCKTKEKAGQVTRFTEQTHVSSGKGKSKRLKVSDKCPGCAGKDRLDISPAGFNAIFRPEITSPSDPNWELGEIFGPNVPTIANRGPMTWQFVN